MSNFETIDTLALTNITGAGSSTDEAQFGVQAPLKEGPVNLGINVKQSNTDYKTCVDAIKTMPNAKPSDIVSACGLPPVELRSIVKPILTSLLELVSGGAASTTTTEAPFFKQTTTTSDYKTCVDQVKQSAWDQYPSTAAWWNPWSTDTNAGPRAQTTVTNMRNTCGLPPAN